MRAALAMARLLDPTMRRYGSARCPPADEHHPLGCPAFSGLLFCVRLCCVLLVQVFGADFVWCPVAQNEPSKTYHTTGFTRDETAELCAYVRAVNETAAESDKVTWPPILGLFMSVVVTLTYLRRNRIQAEIGESYGVSQSTISRAVTALTPLLGTALA